MHPAKIIRLGTFLAACTCGLVGSTPPGAFGAAPADASAFEGFANRYFAARFAMYPTEATGAGLHDRDTELEDWSAARVKARLEGLRDQLATLVKVETATFDDQIDSQALEAQIRAEILDLETLRYWEINPMLYAGLPGGAIDGLIKRDFAPASDRLRLVIAREGKIPAVFAAARANLKNPPGEFTDLAIRMAKGSVGFFEGSVATWARTAAAGNADLLAEFTRANAATIAAVREFAAWLDADLKPRSTGRYAIGAANFLAKLKYEEMVELPLADLLAKGEAQLARDYAAFVATARVIDATKTPLEVMQGLSRDHPTAEGLLPSVRKSIDESRQYLVDNQIVTIPSEVRPSIEETPPYARSGSFASMSTPGPFETRATEAFYYVTPVEADWSKEHAEEHLRLYNPPVVAMINVHEAYPGHFLQFLYVGRFPTMTRKLVSSGTNVEGWAHYCEQMMVDQGFGNRDPKVRLAQLQEALLRDCRYVVGIKLHTEGWTVAQGAKLFEEKGFQEPANAFEEARRGAYNPTYLYYTLGKLQIQDLRAEYQKNKGGTLRDFHDAFVQQGGLPIALIRQILFR